MEDEPPSPSRRSPSPQRGVLTPSMNLEDEFEQQMQDGADTMMMTLLLEKKKPAATVVKKTACRETRSLPCSPQHRLVDDRHQWIEEKLLSFDEHDKAKLTQPSSWWEAGRGELVENRHKWIQQEILDKKTMKHASPRFDEGKYGPIRVANGSPPSSPKNNIADEYCGIVEVISSADDDELEPAVERTSNNTIDCESNPPVEMDTPQNAAIQKSEALESVQESVSQQQDAEASSAQGGAVESMSAGAVSLSDTISMDDFNVPDADSQSVNLDTGILPWEVVVEQQRSKDVVALETTAATDDVLLSTKAELPTEEKKIDDILVAVGPESGKDEAPAFLGNVETPHSNSTQLETKCFEESTSEKGVEVAPDATNDEAVKDDVKVPESEPILDKGGKAESEVAFGENFDHVVVQEKSVDVKSSDDESPKEADSVAAIDASVQAEPSPAATTEAPIKEEAESIAVTTSSPEPTVTAIREVTAEIDVGDSAVAVVRGEKEEAGATLSGIADFVPSQPKGADTFVPADVSEEQSNKVAKPFDSAFAQRSSEVVVKTESVKQFAEQNAGPESAKPMSDESTDEVVLVKQEACSTSNDFACRTEASEPACAPTAEDAAVIADKQKAPTKSCDVEDKLEASKETALFDGRSAAVEAPTHPEENKKEVQFGVFTAESFERMGSTVEENPSLTEQYVSTILMTEGAEERMATMTSWVSLGTRSTTDMYIESMKADAITTTPKVSAVPSPQDQQTTPVESNMTSVADADTVAGGSPGQDKMNTDCAGAEKKSGLVDTVENEPEKKDAVDQQCNAVVAMPKEAAVAETASLEVQTEAEKCLAALALADDPVKESQMNRRVSFEFMGAVLSDKTADKTLATVGKGSSPAWEAVTDYLSCNSPCHNQTATSFSFEAKLKTASAESTSTHDEAIDNSAKKSLVSGENLASTTQTENNLVAPVEHQTMPSMVDSVTSLAADCNAIEVECASLPAIITKGDECPFGKEPSIEPFEPEEGNVSVETQGVSTLEKSGAVAGSIAGLVELAAEEEDATVKPLDTIVINAEPELSVEVVASPKSLADAGEPARFDDEDSTENQMTTPAEQSPEIDYGYLSQSVVEHARRNKERLEKAKELLLNDVPVPAAAKSSVDPEIEYKKKRLVKAKKLLSELADVKSSIVRGLALPHEPNNSSSNEDKEKTEDEEMEQAKDQTEPITTGTNESTNEEKKITGDNSSTELAEPVSAQCTDQCTIS